MSNLLNKPPLQTCEPISDNKADNNTVPSAPEHNKRQKLIDNSSAEKCISISVGRSPLKTISASESNNIQFRDRSPLRNEENLRSLFHGATIKENVITINVVNNYNQQPRARKKYIIYDSDEDEA